MPKVSRVLTNATENIVLAPGMALTLSHPEDIGLIGIQDEIFPDGLRKIQTFACGRGEILHNIVIASAE